MENELVTVATFPDLTSAQFYKGILEENGLQPFLPEENAAATQTPVIFAAMGGLRLQVPADEADRATALLHEVADLEPEPVEEEEEEPIETFDQNKEDTRVAEQQSRSLVYALGVAALLGILWLVQWYFGK